MNEINSTTRQYSHLIFTADNKQRVKVIKIQMSPNRENLLHIIHTPLITLQSMSPLLILTLE